MGSDGFITHPFRYVDTETGNFTNAAGGAAGMDPSLQQVAYQLGPIAYANPGVLQSATIDWFVPNPNSNIALLYEITIGDLPRPPPPTPPIRKDEGLSLEVFLELRLEESTRQIAESAKAGRELKYKETRPLTEKEWKDTFNFITPPKQMTGEEQSQRYVPQGYTDKIFDYLKDRTNLAEPVQQSVSRTYIDSEKRVKNSVPDYHARVKPKEIIGDLIVVDQNMLGDIPLDYVSKQLIDFMSRRVHDALAAEDNVQIEAWLKNVDRMPDIYKKVGELDRTLVDLIYDTNIIDVIFHQFSVNTATATLYLYMSVQTVMSLGYTAFINSKERIPGVSLPFENMFRKSVAEKYQSLIYRQSIDPQAIFQILSIMSKSMGVLQELTLRQRPIGDSTYAFKARALRMSTILQRIGYISPLTDEAGDAVDNLNRISLRDFNFMTEKDLNDFSKGVRDQEYVNSENLAHALLIAQGINPEDAHQIIERKTREITPLTDYLYDQYLHVVNQEALYSKRKLDYYYPHALKGIQRKHAGAQGYYQQSIVPALASFTYDYIADLFQTAPYIVDHYYGDPEYELQLKLDFDPKLLRARRLDRISTLIRPSISVVQNSFRNIQKLGDNALYKSRDMGREFFNEGGLDTTIQISMDVVTAIAKLPYDVLIGNGFARDAAYAAGGLIRDGVYATGSLASDGAYVAGGLARDGAYASGRLASSLGSLLLYGQAGLRHGLMSGAGTLISGLVYGANNALPAASSATRYAVKQLYNGYHSLAVAIQSQQLTTQQIIERQELLQAMYQKQTAPVRRLFSALTDRIVQYVSLQEQNQEAIQAFINNRKFLGYDEGEDIREGNIDYQLAVSADAEEQPDDPYEVKNGILQLRQDLMLKRELRTAAYYDFKRYLLAAGKEHEQQKQAAESGNFGYVSNNDVEKVQRIEMIQAQDEKIKKIDASILKDEQNLEVLEDRASDVLGRNETSQLASGFLGQRVHLGKPKEEAPKSLTSLKKKVKVALGELKAQLDIQSQQAASVDNAMYVEYQKQFGPEQQMIFEYNYDAENDFINRSQPIDQDVVMNDASELFQQDQQRQQIEEKYRILNAEFERLVAVDEVLEEAEGEQEQPRQERQQEERQQEQQEAREEIQMQVQGEQVFQVGEGGGDDPSDDSDPTDDAGGDPGHRPEERKEEEKKEEAEEAEFVDRRPIRPDGAGDPEGPNGQNGAIMLVDGPDENSFFARLVNLLSKLASSFKETRYYNMITSLWKYSLLLSGVAGSVKFGIEAFTNSTLQELRDTLHASEIHFSGVLSSILDAIEFGAESINWQINVARLAGLGVTMFEALKVAAPFLTSKALFKYMLALTPMIGIAFSGLKMGIQAMNPFGKPYTVGTFIETIIAFDCAINAIRAFVGSIDGTAVYGHVEDAGRRINSILTQFTRDGQTDLVITKLRILGYQKASVVGAYVANLLGDWTILIGQHMQLGGQIMSRLGSKLAGAKTVDEVITASVSKSREEWEQRFDYGDTEYDRLVRAKSGREENVKAKSASLEQFEDERLKALRRQLPVGEVSYAREPRVYNTRR